MMPQDFPSSRFEQADLGAIQAYKARAARTLGGVERELRELRRRWAHMEAGRRDFGSEVVPELVALSDRVGPQGDELHRRPTTTSGRSWPPRHHRRQRH